MSADAASLAAIPGMGVGTGTGSGSGGSTHADTGTGEAPTSNNNTFNPNLGGTFDWQQLYTSKDLLKPKGVDTLKGLRTKGGVVGRIQMPGQAGGETMSGSFQETLKEYSADAEKALDKDPIPQEYRDLVRMYYRRFE